MSTAASGPNAAEDARLVPLLIGLSFVTGSVDAVSILRLGHVFVANMTGNIVYLGFSLAGATGFSVPIFLVALGAFVLGACFTGRHYHVCASRRQALAQVALAESLLVAAACVVVLVSGTGPAHYPATALLAIAMGAQNAIAYRLAVPSLTTTVFTLTLVGLTADPPDLRHHGSLTRRRVAAMVAILAGAVAGGLLVLQASTAWALAAITVLLGLVAAFGFRADRRVTT